MVCLRRRGRHSGPVLVQKSASCESASGPPDEYQLRNDYINSVINSQGEQTQSNIETNMQESITNSQKSRKEYLQGLAGGTTE